MPRLTSKPTIRGDATDMPADHRFIAVIEELYDNFMARGWEGPYYVLPDDSGVWEVCMLKSGEPDSRRPMRIVKVFARVHITADEAEVMKVEELAYKLTIAVAGRAAHEALEWCWLRGQTFIDPHNADVIAAAAKSIEYSLVNQLQRDD